MTRQGYDIIGDIHGNAKPLRALLKQMGYRERQGVFGHLKRHAIFVGDILNRGLEIREAVAIVRPMVDAGNATLLLGNHEIYALYHHFNADESSPFAAKARHHLAETLWQYRKAEAEWSDVLEWFSQRPLWFEKEGLRVVHACWNRKAMLPLKGRRLKPDDLRSPTSRRFQAMRTLLEGPSITAPFTLTPEEKPRSFRIKWWLSGDGTWKNCGFPEQSGLPEKKLPQLVLKSFSPYPVNSSPVFFGHYGFLKKIELVAPNLACVDMGVAKGGPLAAYRWNGERVLRKDRFEWV